MTLFGFQLDQLNLWASYYLPKTLNPKVKVLSHLSPLSFCNINVTIKKSIVHNFRFWYPKKINERKKSWKTNKEKEQGKKDPKNENWLDVKI